MPRWRSKSFSNLHPIADSKWRLWMPIFSRVLLEHGSTFWHANCEFVTCLLSCLPYLYRQKRCAGLQNPTNVNHLGPVHKVLLWPFKGKQSISNAEEKTFKQHVQSSMDAARRPLVVICGGTREMFNTCSGQWCWWKRAVYTSLASISSMFWLVSSLNHQRLIQNTRVDGIVFSPLLYHASFENTPETRSVSVGVLNGVRQHGIQTMGHNSRNVAICTHAHMETERQKECPTLSWVAP